MRRKTITQEQFDKLYKRHREQAGLAGSRILQLTDTIVRNVVMDGLDLSNARFTNCSFESVQFPNVDMSYSSFYACQLTDCIFDYTKAFSTTFNKSVIANCEIENSAFTKSTFVKARLSNANTYQTGFKECNFVEAKIRNCDFLWSLFSDCTWLNAIFEFRSLEFCNTTIVGGDLPYASCTWKGFGEQDRIITAIKQKTKVMFFCGCFSGDKKQLERYIERAQYYSYRASRRKAMEFLLSCLQ
jgi:uncharacterized protein YjbI with pentapeptide repeats